MGVAEIWRHGDLPGGLPDSQKSFLGRYTHAIVLGAQVGKLGHSASGDAVAIFLEKAALAIAGHITEKTPHAALIVHAEDEFNPRDRVGMLSLKALAKAAGLGWQGRSLLIVSPEHGVIHRLVAVLTDIPLAGARTIPNQCGSCSVCVQKCPTQALRHVMFADHPATREEVLDLRKCLGDHGCMACILSCPWTERALSRMPHDRP